MYGNILIRIKPLLIASNFDEIIHTILHEYFHAIYEAGIYYSAFFSEIKKLKQYYARIDYPTVAVKSKEDLGKEQFCQLFPMNLMEFKSAIYSSIHFTENEKKDIAIICEEIIKKFMFSGNYILNYINQQRTKGFRCKKSKKICKYISNEVKYINQLFGIVL